MIYYSKILFAQREGIAEKNLEACGEYSKNPNNFFLVLHTENSPQLPLYFDSLDLINISLVLGFLRKKACISSNNF